MKCVGKLCLCLAGGLVLNASLRAGGTLSPDNPYAGIADRNVFDVHPPPPVDPNAQAAAVPPPKITLNGIISTLGHLQALYKVAVPAKPGQPPKDQFYILGEGEAQDEIEVTKIDEKGGLVTFNNHGTEQELPLTPATAGSGPAPAPTAPAAGPGPGPGFRPGFPRPGFPPAGGGNANNTGIIRFGQSSSAGGPSPNANNAYNSGANPSSRLGVAMGGAGGMSFPQQQQMQLSGDDQAVLVAAHHAIAESQGDPVAKIFPPTDYDTQAGATPNLAPPPAPDGTPQP